MAEIISQEASPAEDAYPWMPATILRGSPGYMEKPHVTLPVDSPRKTPQPTAKSTSRHVSEQAFRSFQHSAFQSSGWGPRLVAISCYHCALFKQPMYVIKSSFMPLCFGVVCYTAIVTIKVWVTDTTYDSHAAQAHLPATLPSDTSFPPQCCWKSSNVLGCNWCNPVVTETHPPLPTPAP